MVAILSSTAGTWLSFVLVVTGVMDTEGGGALANETNATNVANDSIAAMGALIA